MIELKEVKKSFENVKAVDGISFKAEKGEIFGLIGPNGAGKSTTIRMIMNILAPDSGKILFDGIHIEEEDKKRIGYLPEERGLYKKVKVNDILRYFASLKSDNEKLYQKNIDTWLAKFGLLEWKDKKVETLSKGMGQKIQFITSVAHDPDILFFDEPFSGLDPVSSDMLREAIQELGAAGKTVLFSTHIMEHAEKICNKIFLIDKGKEVVSGSMEDVKSKYGKNSVSIEFDGDGSFIRELPMVKDIIEFPRYIEVSLNESGGADKLLAALVGKISVKRFELVSPSLHKIFVDLVNGGNLNE